MQTFLHSTTPSWNARSVINKKLKTGSLEATFLRHSSFKMPGLTRDNEIAHQSQSLLDNQNQQQLKQRPCRIDSTIYESRTTTLSQANAV